MQLLKNKYLYNKNNTLHNWIKNTEHYKWWLIECGENEALHNDTLQDWRKNTQCYIWKSIKCDLKRKFLKMIHYKIEKRTQNTPNEYQ